MAKKAPKKKALKSIAKAITGVMRERDRREMRAVDTLLSFAAPPRRQRRKSQRKRTPKARG